MVVPQRIGPMSVVVTRMTTTATAITTRINKAISTFIVAQDRYPLRMAPRWSV
jgi:hypothetical protein